MPEIRLEKDVQSYKKANAKTEAERLMLVANALAFVLVIIALRTLSVGDWFNSGLVALTLMAVMVARVLNRRGLIQSSISLVLLVITLVISFSMWSSQGLYSGALLAFPTLLVIAGIIASRRVFAVLLALMLSVVGVITYTAMAGLKLYQAQPMGPGRLVVVSAILAISAIAIWVLMSDLHATRRRLYSKAQHLKRSEAQRSHLAQHDPLTNLPNRLVTANLVTKAIDSAAEKGRQVGLLLLDIDNFKAINDSLGYAAGDELLKDVAARLQLIVREADTISRQGGDEFIMVLSDQDAGASAVSVAQRVQDVVCEPFFLNDMQLTVSMSIGIALYPRDGNDFASLLRKAELATQKAKATGRNRFFLFNKEMDVNTRERLSIQQDLRKALGRNEFVLHFQPIIRMGSGKLIGAEALLRWNHPEHGLLGPDRFIALAEQTGLITDIGIWVLNQACQQAKRWQARGAGSLCVSVNLSAVQFQRGDLEAAILEALSNVDLPPALLELELTESMLLETSAHIQQRLMRLKKMGIKLAIDDFGTGYSNLSYLQRFQVDKLKIDKSFVTQLASSEPNQAIVKAIIQMAHSLNLETTAEGIEDRQVQDILAALGCNLGQGYLYAKPMPADDFMHFSRAHTPA